MKKKWIVAILAAVSALAFAACGGGTDSSGAGSSDTAGQSGTEHVHTLQHINPVAPTCRYSGNAEAWKCVDCDAYFLDAEAKTPTTREEIALDKIPHDGVFHEGVEAVCGKDGSLSYYSCSMCDKYFSDEACTQEITKSSVEIPTVEHLALSHVEGTLGKWKQEGVKEHWFCSACDKYYLEETCETAVEVTELTLTAPYDIPDFVVEVDKGKTPVVLQLTDTQIIDAAQERYPDRLTLDGDSFWATDKIEERCYDYLTEVIEETKPDLIILTGDIVYGEFDDSGSALLSFIKFMESFQIPWAPVFGNHDNESKMGVDWQCEQFENAEWCLFEQKELTGNGNYSVAIAQNEEILRVFYMMDSNGCGNASQESLANGHTTTSVGFGSDQIAWYTEQITELKASVPNVKISFAYHIQPGIFAKAYKQYGFNQSEKYQDINIDTHADKVEGDFGYIGRQLKGPWDTSNTVFNKMKKLGVDSIFVGHEHCNSSSVVYEGVRFQFGQKSSEYDRYNIVQSNGKVVTEGSGTSLIGGTVIPLGADGTILNPYIYYCGFENGQIDWNDIAGSLKKPDGWEDPKPEPQFPVNGLQYAGVNVASGELYADGAAVVEAVAFDETTNAYKLTANSQGKLYINTSLLAGKTTLTFSVYVSSGYNNLPGMGPFAIRVKPDDNRIEGLPGASIGSDNKQYIVYKETGVDAVKIVADCWQTYTVDITNIASGCTEFAFIVAQGNVIYFKDIVLS